MKFLLRLCPFVCVSSPFPNVWAWLASGLKPGGSKRILEIYDHEKLPSAAPRDWNGRPGENQEPSSMGFSGWPAPAAAAMRCNLSTRYETLESSHKQGTMRPPFAFARLPLGEERHHSIPLSPRCSGGKRASLSCGVRTCSCRHRPQRSRTP
jgi:hypothetical protein